MIGNLLPWGGLVLQAKRRLGGKAGGQEWAYFRLEMRQSVLRAIERHRSRELPLPSLPDSLR